MAKLKPEIPPRIYVSYFQILVFIIVLLGCVSENKSESGDETGENKEIKEFIESFEGRGDLTDDSQPTPAQDAINLFSYPSDLKLDLVLAEPEIFQPVEIKFDHRGRLWVVQYSQYPYPEGLKVVSADNHLRVQFDKVPEAPPEGVAGADKITFFEDTDGDGRFEKATDAITGLNIATSVLIGRGKIWVLNPPYLLAYPDPDQDGIPNGDPEIHLKGFGLEDTHAVANSLTWGADGWLYGAQGSTTTATINSAASKNIHFDGQAIWRYSPESKIFEIFAEGGGNTFDIEIDAKGRLYSGDNGTDRGQYYKQGAYYVKNWGKHGPHTNCYSYGYLANMQLEGDRKRFTHAWIKYEGGSLPERYEGKMIAVNPLQSYLQMTRLEANGSTFKNIDEERIVETSDHWFRPVDIKTGPCGNVYLADWYDSRLSHVDPRDTWHKKSGRIYRIHSANQETDYRQIDLSAWNDEQLLDGLSHPNKWIRQQIQQIFFDRKDPHYIPLLSPYLDRHNAQVALEGLWALNACGGFDETISIKGLTHPDPYVRMWAVRLIGDDARPTPKQAKILTEMVKNEMHPEVRSQLAATAKRLKADQSQEIISGLILRDDIADPDIPLQVWWALEAKITEDPIILNRLFLEKEIWMSSLTQKTILSRLGQRMVASKTTQDYHSLTQLLNNAPTHELARPLITGILEGLRGRELQSLPKELYDAIQPFSDVMGDSPLVPNIRNGDSTSMAQAIEIIKMQDADMQERLSYINLFGEVQYPAVVPVLLEILNNQRSATSLKQNAIKTLGNYANDDIGVKIALAYPDKLRADEEVRLAALSLLCSRPVWTEKLLELIVETRQIHKADIPLYLAMQMSISGSEKVRNQITHIWPELRSNEESENEIRYQQIQGMIGSGKGNSTNGRKIYETLCSSCHRIGDLGKDIGPDLSSYDRRNRKDLLYNIIYPSAYIREGYVNYLITTKDGRSVVGNILTNQGNLKQIRSSTGEIITLSDTEIQTMEALERSLMPEGLLKSLSDSEIQDLFSFLEQEP